jgi:hypothetical protein
MPTRVQWVRNADSFPAPRTTQPLLHYSPCQPRSGTKFSVMPSAVTTFTSKLPTAPLPTSKPRTALASHRSGEYASRFASRQSFSRVVLRSGPLSTEICFRPLLYPNLSPALHRDVSSPLHAEPLQAGWRPASKRWSQICR